MIGSGERYIAAKLADGWCVWDLAIGQRASGDDQPSTERLAQEAANRQNRAAAGA